MKALSPLLLFFVVYVGASIALGDFYAIPIIVAFLLSSLFAIIIFNKKNLNETIMKFAHGAGNENVIYMIFIFVLAGAFASLAKNIGAVDATVNLCLYFLPENLILPGLFLATCLVSMSIGTSVGSIVALVPIAAAMATQTGNNIALYTASIVGGAFFGDNLSFISDTTIVATRSLGIAMHQKFRANILIALPSAIISIIIYTFIGVSDNVQYNVELPNISLVLPYIAVIVLAILGINVIIVLLIGVLLCVGVGFFTSGISDVLQVINSGIIGMSELIIVTILAAGLMELIKINGGIDTIVNFVSKRIKNKLGAEISIGALVLSADFCTANNTIAILSVANIAKDISNKFGIKPQRVASLLDTWSCFAQSIIPYGAQLLLASSLANIAPTQIIGFLFYPFVLAIFTLITSFVFSRKRDINN